MRSTLGEVVRQANTPLSNETFHEPVVSVEKWRGARLSKMTFAEWQKYHFRPALIGSDIYRHNNP